VLEISPGSHGGGEGVADAIMLLHCGGGGAVADIIMAGLLTCVAVMLLMSSWCCLSRQE